MKAYGPDFICIGAQKSGTSWLHYHLSRHPETIMPYEKEINYFLPKRLKKRWFRAWFSYKMLFLSNFKLYEVVHKKGEVRPLKWWLDKIVWYARYHLYQRTIDNYPKLFPKKDDRISGDISPSYQHLPEETIKAISKLNPDIKIIFLLRHPTERSWSQLKMIRKMELASASDDQMYALLQSTLEVRDLSIYIRYLTLWEKYFKNVRVWFYDHLCEDAEGLFKEICDFLKINPFIYKPAKKLDEKVFEGNKEIMPQKVRTFLDEYFKDEIAAIHERFSNQYTLKWLNDSNRNKVVI